jgi:diguanylate cyclase (GGDEF)-like protein/hemerythrin-like metal-binding protein
LLKSGQHEPAFYIAMQNALQENGRWEGEVWNRHRDGHLYAVWLTISTLQDTRGATRWRVALFHDVTQQKRSAESVFKQANFDRLTGLPNRYCFFDRLSRELSRARRAQGQVALLYLDLDRFKPINDQHGHEAGDVVLQTVAQRWQACVRAADTLARLGGDEFALIATGLGAVTETGPIAQKLVQALQTPIRLPSGVDCSLGVSIGIALYPIHGQEMDSLMSAADTAMYQSKASGSGHWTLSATPSDGPAPVEDWVLFDDSHRVGVASIDGQHIELVRRVNHINRVIRSNPGDPELRGLFQALIGYAAEHFAYEESLMTAHGYPEAAGHVLQHAHLTRELKEVLERFEPGDELRLLQTTKDWLMGHIQLADRPLGAYLRSLQVA